MPRPRGRHKTARLTVNLEEQVFGALVTIAQKEDAALAWVVRRAVVEFIARELPNDERPSLPLGRSGVTPRQPTP